MRFRYLPTAIAVGTLAAIGAGGTVLLVENAHNATSPFGGARGSDYRSLMGETNAPGWMMGGSYHSYGGSMMGNGSGDPGSVMGSVLAGAPGPRLRKVAADKLASQVPADSIVNRKTNTVTFLGTSVSFAAVASGPGVGMYAYEIAGLSNPTIVVPAGSKVAVEVVNADGDMAHGFVVAEPRDSTTWMPMMTTREVFAGAAVWVLGESNSGGAHISWARFAASGPGTYWYLCPVPGHAHAGMLGRFVAGASS